MLQISHLTMTQKQDQRVLIHDLSFTMNKGDRIALIGEEGNGKSTLLKYIFDPSLIREYCECKGTRIIQEERIGYLPQRLPEEYEDENVYAYLCRSDAFCSADPSFLSETARLVHCSVEDFYRGQTMGSLSGGEKVKLQLASLLFEHPTVLLLDEPSNDLDLNTVKALEDLLLSFDGMVLFISHDEVLLNHCANGVLHLEQLKRKMDARSTFRHQGYEDYIKERSDLFLKNTQKAEGERRMDALRTEKYERIRKSVEYDLRNVSRGDPHTGQLLKKKMKAVKSMGKRYEKERQNMMKMPEQEEAIMVFFPHSCRIPEGKKILDFHLDQLCAPDRTLLAEHIDLQINGPRHVCIIGPNGCGKSTLLKIIASELLERTDIHAAYMPQNYEDLLDLSQTPLDFLGGTDKEKRTRAGLCLGSMKYTSDEMNHPMGDLSGGQRAKVLFLKMVLDEANVLILDEPTRNFSPLSAPVIRQCLSQFQGTIISVSHDRMYMREVCDTFCELTKDGLVPAAKENLTHI
ncbi:MAG: ATP-binding cassette domain-containing protein [Bulleidia sp.]|nr:ATP-binding cassette domain-containing protein [Bulleidia sp.]